MNKRPFYILLVPLLVLLITAQGLASGFVLCIGDDGHSTYEQAVAGRCAPAQDPCPAEKESSCASCEDHCGPCRDFAAEDSLHGRSRSEHSLSVPPLLPAVTAVSFPNPMILIRDLTVNRFALPPPPPSAALLALRTTVLLN